MNMSDVDWNQMMEGLGDWNQQVLVGNDGGAFDATTAQDVEKGRL